MSASNSPPDNSAAVDDLTRLYRETIMRHAQHPVGWQKSIQVTHRNEQFNPLCGDRIVLALQVENERVLDAAFDGEACAICLASASLLCEQAPGHSVIETCATQQWLEASLRGEHSVGENHVLKALLGVRQYPSRVRCAMLPWLAMLEALQEPAEQLLE
jgi:nitrogen fixation NifU-like protein